MNLKKRCLCMKKENKDFYYSNLYKYYTQIKSSMAYLISKSQVKFIRILFLGFIFIESCNQLLSGLEDFF